MRKDKKKSQPRVSVRRIDQAYRVVLTHEGLEHTHRQPLSQNEAWNLVREIKPALRDGRDLNLRHWDTEELIEQF